MALCSVFALERATEPFKDTDHLFDTVLDGDHRIYVLFFYDSAVEAEEGNEKLTYELQEHVSHEKEALNENLERFDDRVFYAEIDVARGDFVEAL